MVNRLATSFFSYILQLSACFYSYSNTYASIVGLKRLYLPCFLTLHCAFPTRSSGRILREETYPLQEVDTEEGCGRLIHGGRLIHTLWFM